MSNQDVAHHWSSSGLGYALAIRVERGDRVVLSAKDVEHHDRARGALPNTALAISLDVTSLPSERGGSASRSALWRHRCAGHNAALDFIGAIEEQDERDYRAQFERQLLRRRRAAATRAAGMRARRRERCHTSRRWTAWRACRVNGYYSASKFALEGLTEALWQEIERSA